MPKIQTKNQKSKTNETPKAEKIKNPRLNEIVLLLESENIININKVPSTGDFEENVKQEIEISLKEKYRDLSEKFSEIRKTGKDLGVLNFKLMIVPLKIRVFLSTYEKKDAENLLNRMKAIEKELNNPKSKN